MLSLLDYHQTTTSYFQKQTSVWQFFANHEHKEEQLKEFKTDLLKNSYKFDETTDDNGLYKKVKIAKEKLSLELPITLYQAQNVEEINASIVYLNGEAHIVFSGKLIQLLTDEEMLAIIGHELSHVQLYTQLNGEVEVADRIITAISNHMGSTSAHYETARLFKLYTEIFCDRGAYLVTGSYSPIISSLVKISTGLQSINADSFIKQAEEIFASDNTIKTLGISHPENFIRARAIWLWYSKRSEAEATIKQMIEGNMSIEELDLFKQQHVSVITEQMINLLLEPQWMNTPQTIALGKQYFSHIQVEELPNITNLSATIENLHGNLKDYLSYILYDFTTVDKTLEDVPLGFSFFLADKLKLDKNFANTVKKEKKLTDKKVTVLKKQTLAEFHKQHLQIS